MITPHAGLNTFNFMHIYNLLLINMKLSKAIQNKIKEFAPHAERMPGVVILHLVGEFPVVYMSANGLMLLGVTLQQLIDLGPEYYNRFFNIEDMEDFLPKISALLNNNKAGESFSYFQQVKYAGEKEWTWHISSTRLFMWDDDGKPLLTITTAIPINRMKHIEAKAERLLKENNFIKKHVAIFSTLSNREKAVLKQVALGKTSAEVADELFISAETAQTHRRNIRSKLNITNAVEFAEYARAFDLI